MKVLCVHPSGLMYNEIFLRLEPLGVELVAAAVRRAGHSVRLLDLQVASRRDFERLLDEFRPDALLLGMNYLANIPEVIYDPKRQLADHAQPVKYAMRLPKVVPDRKHVDPRRLYVLPPNGKAAQNNLVITKDAESA